LTVVVNILVCDVSLAAGFAAGLSDKDFPQLSSSEETKPEFNKVKFEYRDCWNLFRVIAYQYSRVTAYSGCCFHCDTVAIFLTMLAHCGHRS